MSRLVREQRRGGVSKYMRVFNGYVFLFLMDHWVVSVATWDLNLCVELHTAGYF